jgi:tRNA(Ile)-lysidine synthase
VRHRFREHVEEGRLLQDAGTILVALSGGLDSVALLHLLRFGGFGIDVRAAHFDHRMRPGSEGDAAWVRGLCHAWGVPCIIGAARHALRSEAHARDARYAFLDDAARSAGADLILTAHHANDQAETVLFRLARGTGLAGLAGIPVRRGRILRPLLPFTRAELEEYARAARLGWREDPTNADVGFARNRIRHRVLPGLESTSPGATGRIASLAARAAESEQAWRNVIEDVVHRVVTTRSGGSVELARDLLLGYHPHVRARVIRHLAGGFGAVPDRSATAAIMRFVDHGGSGTGIAIADTVRIEREFDTVRLLRVAETAPDDEAVSLDDGGGTGRLSLAGHAFDVAWGMTEAAEAVEGAVALDPESLRFPLMLRGWRPGDRIRLPYGSKKLKKLFQERRVGRAARARVPVLVDAAGTVLWVMGIGRAASAPLPRGQRVFTITVLDGQPY